MPQTWIKALDEYRYPANLAKFGDVGAYPDWFEGNISKGDREQTIAFEDRFRELAPYHLEAWYQVVYWKMYSQGRRDHVTRNAIANIKDSGLTAKRLYELCLKYIDHPDRTTFLAFQKNLFPSDAIPIAATFPAFFCPENFPMVDNQIASWVKTNGHDHIYGNSTGIVQWPPRTGVNSVGGFVLPWYKWCRHTAGILTERTGCHWRARDVEMAVFTAQRKELPLSPLF